MNEKTLRDRWEDLGSMPVQDFQWDRTLYSFLNYIVASIEQLEAREASESKPEPAKAEEWVELLPMMRVARDRDAAHARIRALEAALDAADEMRAHSQSCHWCYSAYDIARNATRQP